MADSGQSDKDISPLDLCGFDDFPLRLGDIMRGERATLGKSLAQAADEVKLRESVLEGIENCDLSVFGNPSFISGTVRSYATYLGLDPQACFEKFCQESGFGGVHAELAGKAAPRPAPDLEALHPTEDPHAEPILAATSAGKGAQSGVNALRDTAAVSAVDISSASLGTGKERRNVSTQPLIFQSKSIDKGRMAFFNDHLSPSGILSIFIVLGLIIVLSYGAWVVLQEVQRVQIVPAEPSAIEVVEDDTAPDLSDLSELSNLSDSPVFPDTQDLAQIYRPQALDTPKLVARDIPIAQIDPLQTGVFAEEPPQITPPEPAPQPQVIIPPPPSVDILALQDAWVQVKQESGEVLFEQILTAGARYRVPIDAVAPQLRAGNAGAVYLMVGDAVFGPLGQGVSVVKEVSLLSAAVRASYPPATGAEIVSLVEDNLLPPVNGEQLTER